MRTLFLIGWCCLLGCAEAATPANPFPQVAHAYLLEVDGVPLWSQQASQSLPPASLTKLMTALLVLEHHQPNASVPITLSASRETGTRLGLQAGESFTLRDLLTATLLHSANDACHALADYLAGSEAAFVMQMNRRAQALGLRGTHFQNACGHDAPGHVSTAADLAQIAHELLKHPALLAITAQAQTRITSQQGKVYSMRNKNALIGHYAGAQGLKTGYTPKAGKCLVAYAQRHKHAVLLVMLHGQDRWWDALDILDLAFDHAQHTP
ncbi:MAG: D-alanyl-D-alanine carboxypeptidase family protein [Gallionella sp.]